MNAAHAVATNMRRTGGALAWVTVGAVFALMTLGNVVSATGSGLACPDWPLCHGRLLPPARPDVLVEYGHRVAALLSTVLLVATVIVTLRRGPAPPVRRIALALVGLLGVQVLLGGLTVLLKLSRVASTAHLLTALLILAGLLALCRAAGRPLTGTGTGTGKVGRVACVTLAVLLVQLVLGGYVRHSGAGLACPDFPLCAGDLLPGHALAAIHWTHRWLGVLLLGALIHLALAARGTPLARLGGAVAGLGLLQVALGIAAVLLRLDPPVRALHAGVGYLLWAVTVWLALGAAWPALGGRRGAPGPLGEPARVA